MNAKNRGELHWLVHIMRRLLAPDGCPWDREQTLQTLRPYLIEECYEVLDAIDSGDKAAHTEELGDLLLQIVFQSELAHIAIQDVIASIGDKLIRRHPHVFGDVHADSAEQVVENWEAIKAREKGDRRRSTLDGIPRSLPSLHRCHELCRKARRVGFRFQNAAEARAKAIEELGELDRAVADQDDDSTRREAGDALFALAAWVRELGIQPEDALRQANDRFERRFRQLETLAEQQDTALPAPREQLLALWRETARQES